MCCKSEIGKAQKELLTTAALLCDLPERGLSCGQTGTVVECLTPEVYEIEFSGDEGRAYAVLALPAAKLMELHHEPVREVA